MEIIVCAKDRQAAEANKNASILLQQLDDEKVYSIYVIIIICLCIHMYSVLCRKMKRAKKQLQPNEGPKRSDKGRKNKRLS